MKMLGNNNPINRPLLLLLMVCFLFGSTAFANDPKWLENLKRIQPLVSTQKDFEKIVGKKENKSVLNDWMYMVSYETKDGRWFVDYSNGKCSENKREGYDVDKGVVLTVYFVLDKLIRFSTLKLNENEFEKTRESDTNNVFYTNYDKGVSYTKGGYDVLGSVKIFPSQSQLNFHCSKFNNPK
jgi:hypothetical protein